MADDECMEILVLAFLGWASILATGLYYLITANSFAETFVGTLQSARSEKKGEYFYVFETFLKGNSSNTCLVQRYTPYTFRGDADDHAEGLILSTTRQIWVSLHSHGTCYDSKNRDLYNTTGTVLIVLAAIPILIGFCLFLYNFFKKH